jgi:hypothetical protein
MSRWFRYYDEALDDPKVQKLDGDTFKGWVNLLCLASRNGGKLPAISDIAFALRETEDAARTLVERLLNGGLIDKSSGGVDGYTYTPHSWAKRQYKSDTSNERVKRYRQRSKTVTETAPETEAETDSSVSKDTGAVAPPADPDKVFWDNAKTFIGGRNPGALIGKWHRDYGKAETAKAITAAQVERAVEPISYIEKVLRKTKQSDWEFTGPC